MAVFNKDSLNEVKSTLKSLRKLLEEVGNFLKLIFFCLYMCSNILLNLFLMHVLLFGVYMYHIIGVVLEAVLITAFKDPHRVLFI